LFTWLFYAFVALLFVGGAVLLMLPSIAVEWSNSRRAEEENEEDDDSS
jgi:hypothetical protein